MKKNPKNYSLAYELLIFLSVYFEEEICASIDMLQNLEEEYSKEGYTNIKISIWCSEHEDEVALFGDRLETDDEFEKRLKVLKKVKEDQKNAAKDRKNKEYETFLKLKKKFEK